MDRRFSWLLEEAFTKPGAILIGNDPANFKDSSSICYEIGIQQEKHHKRFLNLFWVENYQPIMYFKHEPQAILQWYAAYPKDIFPSEIAGKFWSKVVISEKVYDTLLSNLLATSYQLVFGSLPKKGRSLIEAIGSEENSFKEFHSLALAVSQLPDVSFTYTDSYSRPMITFQGLPLVTFYFNRLFIRLPVAELQALIQNDIVINEPENGQGWAAIPGIAKKQWKELLLKVIEHKSQSKNVAYHPAETSIDLA